MSRPIGPKERLVLDVAEAYDRAAKAATVAATELFGAPDNAAPVGANPAQWWRSQRDRAREMDAAAETWLEWTWDEGERQFTSRIAGHNTPFRVVFSPLYRKDGVDPTPWYAICNIDYVAPILRYATPDEGKALFEDRIRKRGKFAPKDGAA